MENREIHFYIDSKSAIQAVGSYIVKDQMVQDAKMELENLTRRNKVGLNWIPGHEGHLGNEVADRLAKRGATQETQGPSPSIPVQTSTIMKIIKTWCKEEHQNEWSKRKDCRQTKITTPKVSSHWSKVIKHLSTNQIRIATQLLTGHANLKRHRFVMKLEEDPTCQKCQEEEETAIHFLTRCPMYAKLRWTTLGSSILSEESLHTIDLRKILQFTSESKRYNAQ